MSDLLGFPGPMQLSTIRRAYDHFAHGEFRRDRIAKQILGWFESDMAMVEIPEFSEECMRQDVQETAKNVLTREAFRIWKTYLLETDLRRTEEAGFLSDHVVEIIVYGISQHFRLT